MSAVDVSAGAMARLHSLDRFRGLAVALMILVNNPGSWRHIYAPLRHAPWHGWTLTDLVFPFFLFAVGNALVLNLARWRSQPPPQVLRQIARRTLLIFALGLLLNAAPFVQWSDSGELVARSLHNLRWMGVLQRIALCWCMAALLLWWLGERSALPLAAALLLGYWAALWMLAAPGADPFSLEGFFGTALDRQWLGAAHLYQGEGRPFEPEGLASTLPALAQVLLGAAAGSALLRGRVPPSTPSKGLPPQPTRGLERGPALVRQLGPLLAWACAAGLLAWAWQGVLPINKKLWTPSFVLLTSAWALALLVAFSAVDSWHGAGPAKLADKGRSKGRAALMNGLRGANRRAARALDMLGRNALFIYALSMLLPGLLRLLRGPPLPVSATAGASAAALQSASLDPRLASLAFAVANVVVYVLVAWALDRRRIYIRL